MARKLALSLVCLALVSFGEGLRADSVTHDWPGSGASPHTLDVDDFGGSFANGGNDDSYAFSIQGTDVTSTLTFILFDGSQVDSGDNDTFTGGSGLSIFEPPANPIGTVTEIAALTDDPFAPFTFQGVNTGLDVGHASYVQSDKDFAVFEYTVTNNTGSDAHVLAAMSGDFDVADDNGDDLNGKDLSVPVVYQVDTVANGDGFFYAPGLAVAGGAFDAYLLGACCDLLDEPQQKAYFAGRPDEECDDGNTLPDETCTPLCHLPVGGQTCGDGVVQADEECDDLTSPGADGDGCDHRCLNETGSNGELCGNGTVEGDEECDDSNRTDGDGCGADCHAELAGESCGDGTVNGATTGDQVTVPGDNEVTISIDLGTLAPGQSKAIAFCVVGGYSNVSQAAAEADVKAKASDCIALYRNTIEVCGDGVLNADDDCDDGNAVDGDGCDSNCVVTGCGNGVVTAGEGCDDANLDNGDGCDSSCQVEESGGGTGGETGGGTGGETGGGTGGETGACGNGAIDEGEECDDGNAAGGDGCDEACQNDEFEEANPGVDFLHLLVGQPQVLEAPRNSGLASLVTDTRDARPPACACAWSVTPSSLGTYSATDQCRTFFLPEEEGSGTLGVTVDCGSGEQTFLQTVGVQARAGGGGCSLLR